MSASENRQQDASEAFTFITEKLELPLLTLKVDIYHTGKENATDDHKFVNERLLEVAIPPDSGDPTSLEDCLESYFNNKIEVRRHLERSNTLTSMKSFDSTAKSTAMHVESLELTGSEASSPISPVGSPLLETTFPMPSLDEGGQSNLKRTASGRRDSIIQKRFIPDSSDEDDSQKTDRSYSIARSQPRKGSFRKEVMMPAWQFFSLIRMFTHMHFFGLTRLTVIAAWYTDHTNTHSDDGQMSVHFSSKRPIVGLCLKRYTVSKTGKATRLHNRVDIPTEIGLPHFIQDDNADSDGSLSRNFKLSLQAFVCHRGNSVNSGHYIAIVRGTSADAASAGPNSPGNQVIDDPSRYWIRFDDMADERVTLVDVNKALETESPYLLFYQVLPIDEDASEANLKHANPSSVSSSSIPELDIEQQFKTESGSGPIPIPSRPSADLTRPDSFEHSQSSLSAKRSSVHSDTADHGPKDDTDKSATESAAKTESAKSHKGNSNSSGHSQTNDKRLGATISRFAGLLGKEKTDESNAEDDGETTDTATDTATDTVTDISEIDHHHHHRHHLHPSADEKRSRMMQRRMPRARSRDILSKGKERQRERFRDRTGKRMDRECTVM